MELVVQTSFIEILVGISFIILFFSMAILIYYYIHYFFPLINYQASSKKESFPAVSIVIAAKNEASNLRANLPYIFSQEYSDYEVVVIDDHSKDESHEVIREFNSTRLKHYELTNQKGKKAAIAEGIRCAENDLILLTDADCKPSSKYWIYKMVQQFSDQKQIVLGHGKFYREKGFLNTLIRYEGMLNALQYFSFAMQGKAYMGVGRNLAYSKEIFERSNVFKKHSEVLSGDDDLLVNEMANNQNVAISIEEDSFTFSRGEKSWRAYINQKRRQLQSGRFYKFSDRLRLAVFGLSNLLFNISSLILFIFYDDTLIILGIFVGKLILQWIIYGRLAKKLKEMDLVLILPIIDLFYYLIISLIGASTWIWKVNKWK